MSDQPTRRALTRRSALTGIGASGLAVAGYATCTLAQESPMEHDLTRLGTVSALKAHPANEGDWLQTAGYFAPGDGGGACYRVVARGEHVANDADVIDLGALVALLEEGEAVNYRMFGAVGDRVTDDGVRIKQAHEYANRRQIPVVNLSGEFWIKQTNDIPIRTNVHWGKTTIHIDEKYNDRRNPRFVVLNDRPDETIELDAARKAVLLERIRPGVQLIPELARYAGCLVIVEDADDRIGIREGSDSKSGWAREELFYVEEEGRIIGDIAWTFKNFTSAVAVPCNDNYLVIEGGAFYFSGDSAVGGESGYHHHGFSVQRSRTIIREQWMGLERGAHDTSMQPRRGFYSLSRVYDVTLENIRAMPWEKDREEKDRVLRAGTYGIGGDRMLDCTFRSITAEGGWVAWGVFGTNLNKNFRVEKCRLNRIDVHFHCWNLYIRDCEIGFKGISVTGGGNLVIENTTRHGNDFVRFRRDYGAKWDGHIRLSGCNLRPTSDGRVSVLSFLPADFDYQYPIGYGRSIQIEDLVVDYGAAPDSDQPCWLVDIADFSRTTDGARLLFPSRMAFRNIAVDGRAQGVRLVAVPDPSGYDTRRSAVYDGNRHAPNCTIVCENVQLERLSPWNPDDWEQMHLVIGSGAAVDYVDDHALQPAIRFTDCDNVGVYIGGAVASVHFERCGVNVVTAPHLRGELSFTDCRLRPDVHEASDVLYAVDASLGTRFTNCTLHAPVLGGKSEPALVSRLGFLEVNGRIRHAHLNTMLANDVVAHLEASGGITPELVAKLRSHHPLEV